MARYVSYERINKKQVRHAYDTDTSMLLCQTPKGKLYKKQKFTEFFLYHPVGNKKDIATDITRDLSWEEARQLTYDYGTKDIYNQIFTVWKKSTNSHTGPHSYVTLDDRTRTIAMRHAHKQHMSVTNFVRMLIQKWDDYH